MFGIRNVTKEDKDYWFKMDSHLLKEEFLIKVEYKRGYVILCNNEPIGIMRYNLFWDSIPFLNLIIIDDLYHGKGYGKQAMLYWENVMCEKGFEMTMTSTQVDEQAQFFYRKLGYMDKGALFFDNTPIEQPQELVLIKIIEK